MPYIEPITRRILLPGDGVINEPETPGELNFLVTTLVDNFLCNRPASYDAINAAIGVLECAKLELYRRIAAPYEDEKIVQNGDVYTCRD